jgi:hypothetical protein
VFSRFGIRLDGIRNKGRGVILPATGEPAREIELKEERRERAGVTGASVGLGVDGREMGRRGVLKRFREGVPALEMDRAGVCDPAIPLPMVLEVRRRWSPRELDAVGASEGGTIDQPKREATTAASDGSFASSGSGIEGLGSTSMSMASSDAGGCIAGLSAVLMFGTI